MEIGKIEKPCAHWVGTMPFDGPAEAMDWQSEAARGYVTYVGGGETGERRKWVVDFANKLRHNPALRTLWPGRFRNYLDAPKYRLRKGHKLQLELPYLDYVKEEWPLFQQLRARPGNEHLQFQACMPDPFQVPFFTWLTKQYSVFEDAHVEQVEAIHRLTGGEFVLQLDIPVQTILSYLAGIRGAKARAEAIRRYVVQLAGFIRRLPRGMRVAFHLCFGDLNNKALVTPQSLDSMVDLLCALTAEEGLWDENGYIWEYAHLPVAFGRKAPKLKQAFYRALSRLVLPIGTKLALGLAHEKATLEQQEQVLEWITNLGVMVAMVSCACGEARRAEEDPEERFRIFELLTDRKRALVRFLQRRAW